MGCADPEQLPCHDDTDGAVLPRIALEIGQTERMAEVADSESERSTAWAGRRCELDALLWVPDEVGPAEVRLCDLEVSVDLAFLFEGEIVGAERERAPCAGPCEACPVYGSDGPVVDSVLWLLTDTVPFEVGDPVSGLEQAMLPSSGGSSGG